MDPQTSGAKGGNFGSRFFIAYSLERLPEMPNIEIKASYPDLEKARQICRQLGASFVGVDRQIDTYFKVPHGRLKLRESSLSGTYLIPYIRPDQQGPKKSDYARIEIQELEKTKNLFSQIMGVDQVVKKTREIYLIENIRIHLDQLDEAGNFFEFEAVYENDTEDQRRKEEMKVKELMIAFGISKSALLQNSYQQLVEK